MLYKIVLYIIFILVLSIGFGSLVSSQTAKESPIPIEVFFASVSAYTASPDETDLDHGTTASGKKAEGNIIACPSRYEFGTIVEIKGNEYICEDRMNKRYRSGNYFDILMETKKEAFKWGRRTVEVTVIHI